MSSALNDIAAERRRQIEVEGYTPTRDDAYRPGTLAQAAAAYAYAASGSGRDHGRLWPWPLHTWKPSDARRMLVKAGALIMAEVERIDRPKCDFHPEEIAPRYDEDPRNPKWCACDACSAALDSGSPASPDNTEPTAPRFVAPSPIHGELESGYLLRVVRAFEEWVNEYFAEIGTKGLSA